MHGVRIRMILASGALLTASSAAPFGQTNAAAAGRTVEYTLVTNEIKSAPKGQTEIEVYRFDPGVIVAAQGDKVVLHFVGVKGPVHPVTVEGYGIRGVIRRGETLTLRFHATRAGYFPIVCEMHRTLKEHGPMIATLAVLP